MYKIPLFKVYINPYVDDDLLTVLHSGYIGQGPKVEEFEKALGDRIGNDNCLTLSAGTHGLHLALRDIGVDSVSEVIVTPLSCTASVWPILMEKGRAVWADIQENTLNIDPKSVREKITKNTKAILVVHWGGMPCDMQEIYNIGKEFSIKIIEDAAHAFGSTYRNTIIGDCTFSDYTMFSFQAIKFLTTVDGGALFTNDKAAYERNRLRRWYGINRDGLQRDLRCESPISENMWGYKYHMNDVCATIGLKNLEKVDELIKISQGNAAYYYKELSNISGITLLNYPADRTSPFWIFTIKVENRTSFAAMMSSYGIHTSRVHERIDKHPCVKEFECNLPVLESIMPAYIAVPVGWWITKEDREYIVDKIKGGW